MNGTVSDSVLQFSPDTMQWTQVTVTISRRLQRSEASSEYCENCREIPLPALSAGGAADPGPGEARREPGHGRGLGSSGADGGAQGRCLSRYSEILS